MSDVAPWSIENELLVVSGEKDLKSALQSLKMVARDVGWCRVRELSDWARAGAETYTYEFMVESDLGARHLIAKACVALGPGRTVGEVSEEWLRRRRALSDAGVATPKLYGVAAATMIEEYIPLTLVEAYRRAAAQLKLRLCSELGRTLAIISRLGFLALSLHDLRSRGTDVVVVDFGQDLGPPGVLPPGQADLIHDVLSNFERSGVEQLAASELQALSAAFEQHVEAG